MNDFTAHIKKMQYVFLILSIICVTSWFIFADYRSYFAGYLLGSTVSLINAKYLAWKINTLIETSLNLTKSRKLGVGFITRAALSGLCGVITFKYQIHFSVITVILGLLSSHFTSYLISIYRHIKKI